MQSLFVKKYFDQIAPEFAEFRMGQDDKLKEVENEVISNYVEKEHKILDLCCGPGAFLILLSKLGYDVKGIDFSEGMISEAKDIAKALKIKINVELKDIFEMNEKPDSYDVVLLMGNSIGNFGDSGTIDCLFSKISWLLKNGGITIITYTKKRFLFKNKHSNDEFYNGIRKFGHGEINKWLKKFNLRKKAVIKAKFKDKYIIVCEKKPKKRYSIKIDV